MNIIAAKIAAFIVDKGNHAEFVFNDKINIGATCEPTYTLVSAHPESFPAVNADALVFSYGISLEEGHAELMVCIRPPEESVFAYANADYSPAELENFRRMLRAGERRIGIPEANSFRHTYRSLFGFDNRALNVIGMYTPPLSRREEDDSLLFNSDTTSERLSSILMEDDLLSSDAREAGISFVAIRTIVDGQPLPVMWANGHFTINATEQDEVMIQKIVNLASSHLQTRYLNSLFAPARGFCKHLMV